jgi:diguanylate cyclase (GGDEF)-like protein
MQVMLERFFVTSTPAWRVLLAVFFATPYTLLVLLAVALALHSPEIRAGLNTPVVDAVAVLLLVSVLLSVAMAVWLWPRRQLHQPVPGLTVAACLVIGVTYTTLTVVAGTFTTGVTEVLLGVLAVGLLLFERRPMLLSYVVCVSLLVLYDAGVLAGWWPYAPAMRPAAFVGHQPSWWFGVWRQFVFVAGYAVLVGLMLLLFDRLDAMHAKLTRLSYTDGLTGLANRRRFMEVLRQESVRQQRTGQPLCLVLLDADHFKQVNDQHGHIVGDEVLRTVGQLLMACVRSPTDIACRLGGEEFALILPDTHSEQAQAVCARLRAQLAGLRFGEERRRFRITLSMGLVEARGQDPESVLRQADQQLYRAKSTGRDRVCLADASWEAA